MRKFYGKELMLDIHRCDSGLFTREKLNEFFTKLCIKLDMKVCQINYWDYENEKEKEEAPPHLAGTTAVCFISTSNITIHTLDKTKRIYLNIFSCKWFETKPAIEFSIDFFKGKLAKAKVVNRL